jgi:hypothetical protein
LLIFLGLPAGDDIDVEAARMVSATTEANNCMRCVTAATADISVIDSRLCTQYSRGPS